MNSRSLLIVVLSAVVLLPLSTAAPSAADNDTVGYVEALEKAELIDSGGSRAYQFADGDSAVFTGQWVCQQIAQGRARDSIVEELDHSDGMLLSPQDAGVIYDAATTWLC